MLLLAFTFASTLAWADPSAGDLRKIQKAIDAAKVAQSEVNQQRRKIVAMTRQIDPDKAVLAGLLSGLRSLAADNEAKHAEAIRLAVDVGAALRVSSFGRCSVSSSGRTVAFGQSAARGSAPGEKKKGENDERVRETH